VIAVLIIDLLMRFSFGSSVCNQSPFLAALGLMAQPLRKS